MKKCILLIICLFALPTTYANKYPYKSESNPIYKTLNENIFPPSDDDIIYRLFPTQNMWNFIKLNTRNGQMWQIQYGSKESDRSETSLNSVPLIIKDKEANNRFTLYPTQNSYIFILLDQLDGRTWQVQWSTEAQNRLITPIK